MHYCSSGSVVTVHTRRGAELVKMIQAKSRARLYCAALGHVLLYIFLFLTPFTSPPDSPSLYFSRLAILPDYLISLSLYHYFFLRLCCEKRAHAEHRFIVLCQALRLCSLELVVCCFYRRAVAGRPRIYNTSVGFIFRGYNFVWIRVLCVRG